MGIGNTTTSSAVAAAVLRCDPMLVTGKGAGLSEEGLLRKQQLIAEAIRSYDLYAADPFTVLSTVGGFDIAPEDWLECVWEVRSFTFPSS